MIFSIIVIIFSKHRRKLKGYKVFIINALLIITYNYFVFINLFEAEKKVFVLLLSALVHIVMEKRQFLLLLSYDCIS